MAYTSIVDYLKAQGKDSSFGARSTLAAQKGIQNYTGTAKQNIQLLGILQTPAPANPVYQPTPAEQAVQKSYPGGVVPGAGFPNVESPAQAAVKPGQFENPIMSSARKEFGLLLNVHIYALLRLQKYPSYLHTS